jgi:hypothetical protein
VARALRVASKRLRYGVALLAKGAAIGCVARLVAKPFGHNAIPRRGCQQTLALLLATAPLVVTAAQSDPAFEAFLQRFRAALRAQDGAALADLTRLPFLFENRPRDREAFIRIVPKLFDGQTTRCLLKARPVPEADAQVLFCRPYAFYFRRGPGGAYRLEEFATDGEDAP